MNKTRTYKRLKVLKAIDRLVIFIRSTGMSFREFEKIVDLGNGYIGKQLKRKAGIGSNILLKIAIKYPELNIIWLITGKQKMTSANKLKLLKQTKSIRTKLKASA